MEYFGTVKHHSQAGNWEQISASSLTDAKRKATELFSDGYVGHVIHLIECPDITPYDRHNDIPSHRKVIGTKIWSKEELKSK